MRNDRRTVAGSGHRKDPLGPARHRSEPRLPPAGITAPDIQPRCRRAALPVAQPPAFAAGVRWRVGGLHATADDHPCAEMPAPAKLCVPTPSGSPFARGRPTAKGDVLCQCPHSPQRSSREDCPRNQLLSPLRWGAVSMSPIASAVFARRSTPASTSLPLAKGETEGVGTHSIFAACVARNGSLLFLFKKKYPASDQPLPA